MKPFALVVPLSLALAGLLSITAPRGIAAGVAPAPQFAASSPVKARLFDLAQVRLLDGPFQRAQDLDRRFLLSLDPNRLLLMFRVTAGLSSNAKPLGGWESPGVELRGHTMGHYLSACSLMFASTGDARLRERVDYLVSELAKCQAAMPAEGYHAGYLSAFPESFFDRVDARQPVWAPWYTMHKIMAGLLDAYVHAGDPQALRVLERLAGWVRFRVDRLTPAQMQRSLNTEQGGMNEVLANLAGVTHNPEYLRLSAAFNHQAVFDPLAHGVDALDGLHANTQIPKITGAAREYELTGDPEYHRIAQFFWERVALHRSFAIGGDSDDEHFFPVRDFAQHLSPVTAETCNTYNMLKLTEHIFSWQPAAGPVDFYERGLYNQILGSQDPKTGMFTYFVSLKPGHFKTYSTPEDSFWCCVGTGMENHAKYGEMIYAHDDTTLWVNLFIPSELTWRARGLVVRQETAFPDQPRTELRIRARQPVRLAFKIRQPEWAAGPLRVRVDGHAVGATAGADGYVTVDREWRNGDTVDVGLPMGLRTEALPGDPHWVAIFDGPIVLAGELGTDGMPPGGAYARDQKEFVRWPTPPVPALAGTAQGILKALKPVPGESLTFRTVGIGRPHDVTLKPFFRLHAQRYTVYWKLEPGSVAVR